MRKSAVVLLITLLSAATVSAAVEYEFRQTIRSEVDSIPGGEISGKGVIDGTRSRVDFLSGSKYPPGSYVISLDGSKRLMVVFPSRKEYTDVNVSALATALGSAMKVDNFHSDVQKLDDHPTFAGFPTSHYRIHSSYELTLVFGGIPLRQAVDTVIDKWTTLAFGDVSETYLQSAVRTGNPDVDKLIDAETSKARGLTLKQVSSITTSSSEIRRSADSKLQVSPVRRQIAELVLTSVRNSTVDESYFAVPAGYQKKETAPNEGDQSGVHILAMEPEKH